MIENLSAKKGNGAQQSVRFDFQLRKQLKDLENNKQTDRQTDSQLALFSSVKKMTDQNRLEQVITGQGWSGRVKTGQDWAGQVRTGQD